MADSAMIISSALLTVEEFREFIYSNGGSVKLGEFPRGAISEGGLDIWLAMLPKDVYEGFYDAEDILEWEGVLGATPQTLIEIRLDHTRRSRLMYLNVFLNFGKRWNCILHDVDDSILSCGLVWDKYGDILR